MISIVIPTLNSQSTIDSCLKSIFSNIDAPPFEVIVVDGRSSDSTVELARKYPVKILFSDKPQGRQRNAGIANASGDIIAFTDSDCTVSNVWLSTLAKHFDDPSVAGVGGSHYAPENEPLFAQYVDALTQSPLGAAGVRNTVKYSGVREVNHNPPSNSALRKSVLQDVGGFEDTFAIAEDVILDAKIKRKGYKLIYDPNMIVWHPRKHTLRGFVKQLYWYGIGRASSFLLYPESLPISYLCVAAFTLGTVFTIPLLILVDFLRPVIAIGWSAYILFVLIFSFYSAIRNRKFIFAVLFPPLAIIEHFTLGLGFIVGLIKPFRRVNKVTG